MTKYYIARTRNDFSQIKPIWCVTEEGLLKTCNAKFIYKAFFLSLSNKERRSRHVFVWKISHNYFALTDCDQLNLVRKSVGGRFSSSSSCICFISGLSG